MNDDYSDDLERMIGDSLEEHAAGAPMSAAGIDAVYDRVARRRARRRGVAAVASVGLIAAGVVALAVVGDDDSLRPAAPPESAPMEGALAGPSGGWAEVVPAGTPVWRCSGNVMYGDADGGTYWTDCESTTLDQDVGVMPDIVPTTVPWSGDCWATTSVPGDPYATSVPCRFAPATTVPWPTTTVVICESSVESVPVTIPCGTLPPSDAPFATSAVTNPPVTTTTIWCQEGVEPNGVPVTVPGCVPVGTVAEVPPTTSPIGVISTTTSNP